MLQQNGIMFLIKWHSITYQTKKELVISLKEFSFMLKEFTEIKLLFNIPTNKHNKVGIFATNNKKKWRIILNYITIVLR